jgi:exodeoxyribonuclease VII large subunit
MKSQWEFGELFGPEATRQVLTVSELTARIRRIMEQNIGEVWVTGEVSNLRAQSSGHLYFTLKDNDAQLSCVLFRGEPVPHRDYIKDGQKLNIQGLLTVYEVRGQYQLLVRAVELQGIGALQVAFERLKRKLQAEGLFAQERKRPLPQYPQRIGLVTSSTGAAIRDVLHVIERRQPGLEIILSPCRVQGEGAAHEIAWALQLLNEWSLGQAWRDRPLLTDPSRHLDLILLTRGGGSLEDLWAFNEEVVARAIFQSAIPVLSAVGHEIDFTIADFVADLRAATPSAAAEIITEGIFASRRLVAETRDHLRQIVADHLDHARDDLSALANRLARLHPRRVLNDRLQYLDELGGSLLRCLKHGHRHWRVAWQSLRQRLARERPSLLLKQRRLTLEQLNRRLRERWRAQRHDRANHLAHLASRLRLLSPENVLARGYSITQDRSTGRIIRRADDVKSRQKLRTRLAHGQIDSTAE